MKKPTLYERNINSFNTRRNYKLELLGNLIIAKDLKNEDLYNDSQAELEYEFNIK